MAVAGLACGNSRVTEASESDESGEADSDEGEEAGSASNSGSDDGESTGEDDGTDDGPESDLPTGEPTSLKLDVVFVIDNSAHMGAGQQKLAELAPNIVGELDAVADNPQYELDVNMMVTTTDLGHPLCTPFQPPGYEPAQGSPVTESCRDRLDLFVAQDDTDHTAYCDSVCPVSVVPDGDFIHFDGDITNVPGDAIDDALKCMIPQGVRGCGFESPLEAALQAVNPGAAWNTGDDPFLREDSDVVFFFLANEPDCSVSAMGYGAFTNDQTYWEIEPNSMQKVASSAVCWNAGTDCGDADMNGTYASCDVVDNGVLHPLDRYTNYIENLEADGRSVAVIGLLGIPSVTGHSPDAPFEPVSGGVEDLVYREWKGNDIQGGGWTVEDLEWAFGMGPGCGEMTAVDAETTFGTPPARMLEVCDATDLPCCLESVCDADYSGAAQCLKGVALHGLGG